MVRNLLASDLPGELQRGVDGHDVPVAGPLGLPVTAVPWPRT
jgi:hypothetical protein